MANELQVTIHVTFAKSGLPSKDLGSTTPISITVAGAILYENIQEVGTSQEPLDITGIATLGLFYAKNLDPTLNINIRPGTGLTDLVELRPGEACLFRLQSGITPYIVANGVGPAQLHYCIFDE